MARQIEKRKEYSQKWYEENSEALSETRKDRYKTDPEYRERQINASRKNRKNRKAVPVGLVTPVTKQYHGLSVLAYSAANVAAILGKTPQLLRHWEAIGWIPETIFNGTHRFYTVKQVALMRELSEFVSANRYIKSQEGQKSKEALIAHIHDEWRK